MAPERLKQARTETVRLRYAADRYRNSKTRARVETDFYHCSTYERWEYHFYRFIDGASDDLAIRGWKYIMDTRQRRTQAAEKSAS